MLARECQFFLFHVEWRRFLNHIFTVFDVGDGIALMELRERIELGFQVVLLQFSLHDRVVVPENEGIVLRLVASDSHLRINIVLHLVVVAVQMVGRDVHQNGNVRTEVVHVIQLETRQLYHIVVEMLLCHLQCQASADVASQAHVIACLLQDVVDEGRCRRLTIRTSNANHLRICVASSKFYFRNHMDTLLSDFHHHRCRVGNTWTLHHLVRIQNQFFCVMSFLPSNAMLIKLFLVFVLDDRHVGNKHIKSFHLCQDSSSCTALSCS